MLRKSAAAASLALGGAVLSGSAGAQGAQTYRFPISGTIINPCNGDLLGYQGVNHLVMHITQDSDGGIHGYYSLNHSNLKAVAPDGTEYSLTGGYRRNINQRPPAPWTVTSTERFNVVSHGSEPNWIIWGRSHLTINANGEVTAAHSDFDTECRG